MNNNIIKLNNTEEATLSSSSSATLEYSGKITISWCRQNKILRKKIYHNAGCDLLFKFIALCWKGDYVRAEKYRPVKIQLFNNTMDNIPGSIEEMDWDRVKALTGFITMNRNAEINDESDGNGFSTTLHFLVPTVYIKKNTTTNTINQIGLYSNAATKKEECSAYFLCVDADNPAEWAPLETQNEDENINLIIDWELSIKNSGGN